ncbi:DUF4097 family beta strand repeat protein [candidate division KSB1 bacterium]|nr:DUF4097 family beta strand repeat protein [candidate division KSB1 bacterium]
MKTIKILILLLVTVFSFVYADIDANLKETFDVNYGGTLFIESDFGTIEVTSWDQKKVQVEVLRSIDAFTQKEADRILKDLEITFDKKGDDVYVFAEYDRGHFRWSNNRIKMRFVVSVPKEYNVNLKTEGGSISVSDLEGKAESKTSGGSLTFGQIKGPVNGNTSGGSIKLDGCIGDANVKTSGGSIRIGQVDGNVDAHTSGGSITIDKARGGVIASTSGGSINVEEVMGTIEAKTSGGSVTARISAQPQSDCRLSTSGGSVNVQMADNIKVNLDAKTSGGRVSTEFPVTVQGELSKTQLQAEINGGGPLLYLRTSGGNINLKNL